MKHYYAYSDPTGENEHKCIACYTSKDQRDKLIRITRKFDWRFTALSEDMALAINRYYGVAIETCE